MRALLATFNRRDLVFLTLSAALVALYVLVADGGFPLDDSWIHQVYGRNLGNGFEWAFVPGEPSAASTSPLYTVLLAIGYLFNLPYMFWTHLLGTLALAVAAMLGARMAEMARPDVRGIGWVTGLALIAAWHLVWAAASGMETMLFAAFTEALIFLAWREFAEPEGNTMWSGAVFGAVAALAMTTRPEGILLAGLCGLAMLTRWNTARADLLRWIAGAALGFGLFILPYLLLNLSLAGGLLPNTADAKFVQHAPIRERFSYIERLWRMSVPALAGGQLLLIPGMVAFVWMSIRTARDEAQEWHKLLPVVWFLALVALYAARLPAAYQHGRYIMPGLPALIVAGVIGTADLLRLARKSPAGRVVTRTLAIAAAVAFAYFGIVTGPGIYATDVQIIDEEMVDNAKWINDNLNPADLLAIHDIGAVGYFAPRPIVDIAGLVTPEVIDLIGDEEALWDYMREQDAFYLMAFTDQVPGGDPDDERICFLHQSNGESAVKAGGTKMVIYRLNWDGNCPPD